MFECDRLPDWTARWAEFIQDCLGLSADLKLDWANINCTQFSAQGIEAITGKNPYEEGGWEGLFDSPMSAALEIKRRGFNNLDEVIASLFPEIPLAFVWPGDVVLIRTTLTEDEAATAIMPHGVGLANSPFFFAVEENGLGRGDLFLQATRAFAVGHTI
jgi:hypothetical protein